MEKKFLSIEELEALLNTEEYRFKQPQHTYVEEFERCNKWTSSDVLGLFEKMTEELGGTPPAPDVYLAEALKKTKAFWFRNSPTGVMNVIYKDRRYKWQTTQLRWTKQIENNARCRLARMYQSSMVEYSATIIMQTVYPEITLLASKEIDWTLGVDLVAVSREKNKIFYVHVTKNNAHAENSVLEKSSRKVWTHNKHSMKVQWKRSFTDSHTIFLYDNEESDSTNVVNGHFIFKEEYIKVKCEEKLSNEKVEEMNEDSELLAFHYFLTGNQVRSEGINKMIITQKSKESE